jgi:hypothetical protein
MNVTKSRRHNSKMSNVYIIEEKKMKRANETNINSGGSKCKKRKIHS